MSLESQIKDALTRHESEVQTRPGVWAEVENRVRRSYRRRVLATVVGAAAAIAIAVVVLPLEQDRRPPPIGPGPSMSQSPQIQATPNLRLVNTLRGTRSDVFTGEVALDASRDLLLVGEQHESGQTTEVRVRVVDARTLRTIRRIGPGVLRLIDPPRGHVYVDDMMATKQDGRRPLHVFDIDSGVLVADLPADQRGTPPALDRAGGRLFLTRGNGIDVYDVKDFRLVNRFEVPQLPHSIAFDEKANLLYVSREDKGVVLVLDANTGRVNRTLGDGLETLSQGGPLLASGYGWFAARAGSYRDSVLAFYRSGGDRAWIERAGREYSAIAVDYSRALAFDAVHDLTSSEGPIPNDPPDLVEARSFATGEIRGSMRVPDGPVSLAIDTKNRLLYVVTLLGNTVEVIGY